jgi:hypothetical protein
VTVDGTSSSSNQSAGNNTTSGNANSANATGSTGYDPPVVRPGAQNPSSQTGPSEDEFRRQMEQQRDRFQRGGEDRPPPGTEPAAPSRPREDAADSNPAPVNQAAGGWGDSAMTRRRYDDQGNRATSPGSPNAGQSSSNRSSGQTYDEQGNYRDGRTRENRVYNAYDNTSRPIGRYDAEGNRPDSPRRQYDAQGNYTSGQTRQNRVYNPYNNTSRPVGNGGGSSTYQRYQAIQQQSNERINAIRNSGGSNRSAPAPATVPFPTATPTPTYIPNQSSPSNSSTSGGSTGRITFDDSVPRGRTRFGYDDNAEKLPAVTPRQSGTSPRGASAGLH